MKCASFLLAGLVFFGAASAQDLPPEVLLLSRTENHIKDELQRLSSISCVETVQRQVQRGKGKMKPLDTVRLEVLTNGNQELFASPGDRKFSDQKPLRFAGSGMLGNGLLGPYLKNVLLNGNATTVYKGEEEVGGLRLARYDYRLSPLFSGQTVEIPEGSGTVGLEGSFWVDPRTYDIVRLDLNADDIPPTLPLSALTTSIHYGRTVLANNLAVLLPETADVRMVMDSGEISEDQVEFTHCRVFGAESTISFSPPDSAEPVRFGATTLDDTLRPLPAGLQIAVQLHTRVTADIAVGALIDGVVAADVKDKRTVVIPAGSPVRGRIRRLERYTDPFDYYTVGLEFTEVEVEGIRHIFYADLADTDLPPSVELTLSTGNHGAETLRSSMASLGGVTMETREKIFTHNLPGVAVFFVRGNKLDLPQDFRTVWKTRPWK
jgi:hypothetical protein